MDYIKMVEEFHKTFKHPVLESPQIPEDRKGLRVSLMQEELDEIKESLKSNDIVGVSDGLCDLMFVLCGSIIEFGLSEKFNRMYKEVWESNMSKSCISIEEARETVKHYSNSGIDSYIVKVGERWVVYRGSDNKILKSINYKAPDLEKIIVE